MKKLIFSLVAGLCCLTAANTQAPLTVIIENRFVKTVEFEVRLQATLNGTGYVSYDEPTLSEGQIYTNNYSIDTDGNTFYLSLFLKNQGFSGYDIATFQLFKEGGTLHIWTLDRTAVEGQLCGVSAEYTDNKTGTKTYWEFR